MDFELFCLLLNHNQYGFPIFLLSLLLDEAFDGVSRNKATDEEGEEIGFGISSPSERSLRFC